MASPNDTHRITTLASAAASGQAIGTHAMAPGAGESTVESQRVKALAYWTAIQAAGGLDSNQAAAVADAINHLTNRTPFVA
jgi:hypothetical protein